MLHCRILHFSLILLLATLPFMLRAETSTPDTAAADGITPQWAENYLIRYQSPLLADGGNDQVTSFYYFGTLQGYTLMGLERVRGEDYEQFFSLMIFRDRQLLGYYRHVLSFPSGVSSAGDVSFPRGVESRFDGGDKPLNITAGRYPALCQTLGNRQTCIPWTPAASAESD